MMIKTEIKASWRDGRDDGEMMEKNKKMEKFVVAKSEEGDG